MNSPERLSEWSQREIARLQTLRGEARLAAMWHAAQHLATEGDVDEQIVWLKGLMEGASDESRIDYTLQAFGELRRIYDSDARYADLRPRILWYFKWLVEKLPEYADVPLETIERVFAEMESFYSISRESPRPIYELRCYAAVRMGRKDEAAEWYEKWQSSPHGKSDDCAACELDRQIAYLLSCERREEAMQVAEPVFRGKVFCNDTPKTYTRLLGPALASDRKRLALVLLHITRRLVRQTPSLLAALAAQTVFRLTAGQFDRSRRFALLALRRALAATSDMDRYSTYRSCGLWAALAVLAGQHQFTLPRRLMPAQPANAAGHVGLAEAASLCFAEASAIAARLDQRNGTTTFVDQLNEIESTIARAVEKLTPKDR